MHIHALVKIVLYITALVMLHYLSVVYLFAFFLCSTGVALYLEGGSFTRRIGKLRWLVVSIILIYAFTVPGEFVTFSDKVLLLTKEGLLFGLMQVAKLIIAIACLSILFYQTSVYQLIGGLRQLLAPFGLLGFNVNRFVVRLLLTLRYVDEVTLATRHEQAFLNLHEMVEASSVPDNLNIIEVDLLLLSRVDYLILIVIGCSFMSLGLL